MTADTTDGAALLAYVLANPDDDVVRLVLADWYEENGQPERGEFIRVQVELAKRDATPCSVAAGTWVGPLPTGGRLVQAWPDSPPARCCLPFDELTGSGLCRKCDGYDALRRRERELFARLVGGGFDDTGLPNGCVVTLDAINRELWPTEPLGSPVGFPVGFVRRGFVDEIRCPLAVWVGGECDNCGGTGLVDGDRYEQSEPCPECGGEYGPSDEDNPRGVSPGTGTMPGIGKAVVAAHPVTRVTITDQTPNNVAIHDGSDRYRWYRWPDADRGRPVLPGFLPGDIWESDHISSEFFPGSRSPIAFATRDAALSALSDALLAVARS